MQSTDSSMQTLLKLEIVFGIIGAKAPTSHALQLTHCNGAFPPAGASRFGAVLSRTHLALLLHWGTETSQRVQTSSSYTRCPFIGLRRPGPKCNRWWKCTTCGQEHPQHHSITPSNSHLQTHKRNQRMRALL